MELTSVASQHRAKPSGDAPYTTRSRRRRSDVGTPGADVCNSHYWGTTCPSAPTASQSVLQVEGWQECPSWRAIADGARPPVATNRSLGDWPHGWQHSASRTRNLHFRERTLLPDMSPSACALLRS